MNIFISGSLAYDRIMDFPGKFSDHILPEKAHILNICFTVNGLTEKFGGTAGNIAYGLGLLGEKPVIISAAGKDFGAYHSRIKRLGLPDDGIKIVPEEWTAGAYITTDELDNQITCFNPGAMGHRTYYDLSGVNPDDCLVIIAPGNLDDMAHYAEECRQKKIRFLFDPGQSLTAWSGKDLAGALEGAAIFISSDYELEMTIYNSGLSRAQILEKTGTIITTFGDKGYVIIEKDNHIQGTAVAAAVVTDPTGAGDSFRAGLIKGLADGKDVAAAARIGAVLASFSVEKYGTQEYTLDMNEFSRRYVNTFGEEI